MKSPQESMLQDRSLLLEPEATSFSISSLPLLWVVERSHTSCCCQRTWGQSLAREWVGADRITLGVRGDSNKVVIAVITGNLFRSRKVEGRGLEWRLLGAWRPWATRTGRSWVLSVARWLFPWEWDIIIPAPGFHSGSLELDVSRINVSF